MCTPGHKLTKRKNVAYCGTRALLIVHSAKAIKHTQNQPHPQNAHHASRLIKNTYTYWSRVKWASTMPSIFWNAFPSSSLQRCASGCVSACIMDADGEIAGTQSEKITHMRACARHSNPSDQCGGRKARAIRPRLENMYVCSVYSQRCQIVNAGKSARSKLENAIVV